MAATFMEAALHHGGVSLGALGEAQATSPLLWLIDTVPAVMGFLALVVGRRQETISSLESFRVTGTLQTAGDLSA
ncbi:MAG TPA: hypothetical protein VEP68_10430, partial [Anaeromyxobacteraceae bacterium]|nr:hypothetical protein [Anaeromyxobacteraceae bacterium]